MKSITHLALLLLLTAAGSGSSAQGIEFSHDTTLAQLKERARQTGKPVFIDCFTSWCGPCKWMAKNVFPNDTAGTYFNTHFVNAKLDMEKGDGKNVARQYHINSYPTFLFIDSTGTEIHRFLGSQPVGSFLTNAGRAAERGRGLSALKFRYKNGDRSPAFIRELMSVASAAGEDNTEMLDWYFAMLTPENFLEEANFELFGEVVWVMRAEIFEKIIAQREAYEKRYGANRFNQFELNWYNKEMRSCYSNQKMADGSYKRIADERRFANAQAGLLLLAAKDVPNARMIYDRETINYHMVKGDVGKCLEQTKNFKAADAGLLNSVAWFAYENTENPEYLKEALELSGRSVKLDNSYATNDTYASLFYKLGRKKEARKYANLAIEIAKKDNEDCTATRELLEKIDQMK